MNAVGNEFDLKDVGLLSTEIIETVLRGNVIDRRGVFKDPSATPQANYKHKCSSKARLANYQ